MRDALAAGAAILERGGPAIDAVQAAVESMEAATQFNAGRGAVATADGTVELDAAIMDGASRRAGAVAAVRRVRHPVALARAVLDRTPHVLMVGEGAERLAGDFGVEQVPPEFFERAAHLSGPEPVPVGKAAEARRAAEAGAVLPYDGPSIVRESASSIPYDEAETVGAVALDAGGHLAAATSTGGMRGQLPGRVGDAPLPGSGTWAEDRVCAVSATGDGEAFITSVAAHEVATLLRHAGFGLPEACSLVLRSRVHGTGGMIGVAPDGTIAMQFTTPAMARGFWRAGAEPWTAVEATHTAR
jgi:beta-aspartyl-peptidase (threonine type)